MFLKFVDIIFTAKQVEFIFGTIIDHTTNNKWLNTLNELGTWTILDNVIISEVTRFLLTSLYSLFMYSSKLNAKSYLK